MKQLSSSTSSPSPHRLATRTTGSPDNGGRRGRDQAPPPSQSRASSSEERRSRYLVTSEQMEAPTPLLSRQGAADTSPTRLDSASALGPVTRVKYSSTGKTQLTSPPTQLPHTPPRLSPVTSVDKSPEILPPPPPPASANSQLRVVVPERHSENPLFAESEEDDGSKSSSGVVRC